MSKRGERLTREQKHDLRLMGQRGGFTLKKASRVLGIHDGTLKAMIGRESEEFFLAMVKAFPGAFSEEYEQEGDWGPKKIPYEQLGPVAMPGGHVIRVLVQRWDRNLKTGLEARHGA